MPVVAKPRVPVCARGHPRTQPTLQSAPCGRCREDDLLEDIVARVLAAEPSLISVGVRAVVSATTRVAVERRALQRWLNDRPDALRSGASDIPKAGVRLLDELARRGGRVVRARCADCGSQRVLHGTTPGGGRTCHECHSRRHGEPCARCGKVKPVNARLPDGRPLCLWCRANDAEAQRPCGRCGREGRRVAIEDGVGVNTCCYVRPLLRCTVCGVRKGVRPWKTRRPVCAECAQLPREPCVHCGLDAAARSATAADAVCARCRTRTPSPCTGCGVLTIAHDRSGKRRCPDCYARPVGTCGRCGRVRPIVRLATGGDPDLCGVCWRGPVMRCERCGRLAACRGARTGRMLCEACRPVAPQVCSRCGRSKRPRAQWTEGPLCPTCYHRALAAKASCPGCGQWRRLRTYPGHADPVCAECAGAPPVSVCRECGNEDLLFDRGLCPRCSLRHRLNALLGDAHTRARTGLAPLFDALVQGSHPRNSLDWLRKNPAVAAALQRIARGDVALDHGTMDALESILGLRRIRHLERVLTASGALSPRDTLLASLEHWCERQIRAVEQLEDQRVLREYVRWRVLPPLRIKSQCRLLSEASGYGARATVHTAAAFLDWLHQRRRTLSTCAQTDVDSWLQHRPADQTRRLRAFVRWASRSNRMPALDVPAGNWQGLAAPFDAEERLDVARHLLTGADIPLADRVAGALVVIYAQPLARVARLSIGDVHVEPDKVSVLTGRFAIELLPPLDRMTRELVQQRRPAPRKLQPVRDSGWLFLGLDPDHPIASEALGDRLRHHGVMPGRHRLAAVYQLAGEMPPAVLADTIGMRPVTAERWSRAVARPWTPYLAMRAAAEGGCGGAG